MFNKILSLFLIASQFAYAAPETITNDQVQIGKRTSSADKRLVFDINQGVNNPDIRSNVTNQDLQVQANTVRVGKPTAGDKQLDFNIGNGATNPKLRWNNTAGKIEFSNNGTDYKSIGSGGGGDRSHRGTCRPALRSWRRPMLAMRHRHWRRSAPGVATPSGSSMFRPCGARSRISPGCSPPPGARTG